MKLILSLFALVAACSAGLSGPYFKADLYRNTLLSPFARIVGGQKAERHQFPYQGSLQYFGSHICGCVLINPRTVITAAHCRISSSPSAYQVKLGMLKQRENHEDVQTLNVESFSIHPKYGGGVGPDDIAVIILAAPAVQTAAVQPIALPTDQCSILKNVDLSGWGYLSSSNPTVPTDLQFASLPRISNDKCCADLAGILGTCNPLDDSMICITANPGQTQSACNGDSGGPLALAQDDGAVVVGVVSWGINPCGYKNAPSVFTNVCAHLEFIEKHIQN